MSDRRFSPGRACRISLVCGALLLLTDASQAAPSTEPDELLAQGAALLAAGELAAAETHYRGLTERFPGLAEAHAGLAETLERQGRAAPAAAIWTMLGDGFLRAGDYPAATGYLERAVAQAPADAQGRALLGRSLLLSQAFRRGLKHLERAVELGDGSPTTRTFLGSALWENGELERAETVLRDLAEETGSFASTHQLARLLLWQGRHEEALERLDGLRVAGSRAVDLLFDRAQALDGAGRVDEAVTAYRQVVAAAPRRSAARYRLARLLARSGDREAAGEEMATFQRLYQEELERTRREGLDRARLDHAWELLRRGKAGAAAERFAALPETLESLQGLALAHSSARRHREAAAALQRAISLDPDRQDLRLMLAQERLAAEGGG